MLHFYANYVGSQVGKETSGTGKEGRDISLIMKRFRLVVVGLLLIMIPGLVLLIVALVARWGQQPQVAASSGTSSTPFRSPTPTSTPLPLSFPWSTPAPLPTTVLCWKVGNNYAGPLEVCVINDQNQPLAVHPLSEERAREILDLAGFHCLDESGPSWLCEQALTVARCESQLYVTASGDRRRSFGLFQLQRDKLEWANQTFGMQFTNLFDPVQNAQIAYLLWSTEGWAAWPSCQP